MDLATRPARRDDVFTYRRSVPIYFACVGIIGLVLAVVSLGGSAWQVLMWALFAGVMLGGAAVRFHNGRQVMRHYQAEHPGEPIPTLGWFGFQKR